ncbi:MAG: hypothetical protein MUO26_03545 [Methanotrichaceae archaeon]|nr:hypothetical protein [Methanotrichaceae archaeon]
MNSNKEDWGRPQLNILVRSTSAEAVLQNCKISMGSGEGPSNMNTGCANDQTCSRECPTLVTS